MTTTDGFSSNIERAVDEMLDMSKRAKQAQNNRKSENEKTEPKNSMVSINIPSDTLLILGLILILSNENCDKLLLLAMLYILS